MSKKQLTLKPRPPGGLLNREEAADHLKISPETLKKWTTQRRIPIVKMGSAVRYRLVDLDTYIEQHLILPEVR